MPVETRCSRPASESGPERREGAKPTSGRGERKGSQRRNSRVRMTPYGCLSWTCFARPERSREKLGGSTAGLSRAATAPGRPGSRPGQLQVEGGRQRIGGRPARAGGGLGRGGGERRGGPTGGIRDLPDPAQAGP